MASILGVVDDQKTADTTKDRLNQIAKEMRGDGVVNYSVSVHKMNILAA